MRAGHWTDLRSYGEGRALRVAGRRATEARDVAAQDWPATEVYRSSEEVSAELWVESAAWLLAALLRGAS